MKALNIRDYADNAEHRKVMGYFKQTAYKLGISQAKLLSMLAKVSLETINQILLDAETIEKNSKGTIRDLEIASVIIPLQDSEKIKLPNKKQFIRDIFWNLWSQYKTDLEQDNKNRQYDWLKGEWKTTRIKASKHRG